MAEWQLEVEDRLTLVVDKDEIDDANKNKLSGIYSKGGLHVRRDVYSQSKQPKQCKAPPRQDEFPVPINPNCALNRDDAFDTVVVYTDEGNLPFDTAQIYEQIEKVNVAMVFVNETINADKSAELGKICKDLLDECQPRRIFLEKSSDEPRIKDSSFSEHIKIILSQFRDTEKRYNDWQAGSKSKTNDESRLWNYS